MILEVTELPRRAYFSLESGALEKARRLNAVSIRWTRLPGTEMRIALLMAPTSHAWGMQFRHRVELRLALQGLDGSEAEQWLTPWEQVSPSYPLPAAPNSSIMALAYFDALNLRPMDELLKQKQERTLLKLQLMKKWNWPLGLRNLQAQTSKDLRKTLLGHSVPWEAAEVLVAEILDECRRKFPVLLA